MQRHFSAVHRSRPIAWVVVHERAAAAHRILHVREHRRLSRVFVILAANGERDPVTRGDHDARGPDLHVELDRLPGGERLDFIVRVIRAVGQGQLRVELAVRGAQPPLAHRRVRVERALEHDFVALRIENLQHGENVGILGGGRQE